MATSQLLHVDEDGQVRLPVEVRHRLGVDRGGTLAFVMTNDGVLIGRAETLMLAALDSMGAALNEQGVTLDEWIEGAREERAALLETDAERGNA